MTREEDYYGYKAGDIQMSSCAYCLHNQGKGKCDAFPKGIPDEILLMKTDHLEPMEGDNGIQFEARNPETTPQRLIKV